MTVPSGRPVEEAISEWDWPRKKRRPHQLHLLFGDLGQSRTHSRIALLVFEQDVGAGHFLDDEEGFQRVDLPVPRPPLGIDLAVAGDAEKPCGQG